jgi:hypothetical protein
MYSLMCPKMNKSTNPSGISVATGTTSILYNATQIGTYKIKVTTTNSKPVSYTLNAQYPVAAFKALTRLMR